MKPLVSIVIPCYNNTSTLPSGIFSVIAQTCQDWECIVIDDGSTDDPEVIIERIGDPRLKLQRFERNRGRGAARQAGLEQARGEFIAMVDADDWIYPGKLEKQLRIMESEPGIGFVAGPLAVVGRNGRLAGVRSGIAVESGYRLFEPSQHAIKPRVTHAPCMIRASAARKVGYPVERRTGEDAEFITGLSRRFGYAVMSDITYAYTEYSSAGAAKSVASLLSENRGFLKLWKSDPAAVSRELSLNMLKIPVIMLAFALGLGGPLVARRSRAPTPAEVSEFTDAQGRVQKALQRLFSGAPA